MARRRLTMAERFEVFDRENPEVFEALVDLARAEMDVHVDRIGIGALFERVRWETVLSTTDPMFKLDNSFRSFYARKLERECPDLTGVFRTRRSDADAWVERRYGGAAS